MKRRKMSALQRKYFGKRKKRVVHQTKRRVVKMARRRSYRGRARSYARKGIGGMNRFIAPIGAGILENYTSRYLPVSGVAPTVVGMFMHDSTLEKFGLYQVGMSIGNILPLPGLNGGNGGGLL